MIVQTGRTVLAALLGVAALIGLGAFLVFLVAAIADDPLWILFGVPGLLAAVVFGALSLIVSAPFGPTGIRWRRTGLGLIGGLCVFGGLGLYFPDFHLEAENVVLIVVGFAALAFLSWDVAHRRRRA